MKQIDQNRGRPEAYPRPTQTDSQVKNQPEFIDQQPNDFRDKTISDIPVRDNEREGSSDPIEGTKKTD